MCAGSSGRPPKTAGVSGRTFCAVLYWTMRCGPVRTHSAGRVVQESASETGRAPHHSRLEHGHPESEKGSEGRNGQRERETQTRGIVGDMSCVGFVSVWRSASLPFLRVWGRCRKRERGERGEIQICWCSIMQNTAEWRMLSQPLSRVVYLLLDWRRAERSRHCVRQCLLYNTACCAVSEEPSKYCDQVVRVLSVRGDCACFFFPLSLLALKT